MSLNALPLLTCPGTVHMTQGPIILIMNQYAYYGKGVLSILSGNYHTLVLILMINPGHKQDIVTPNQWIIPVNIINGLTRMCMQPSMDEDVINYLMSL